MIALALHRYRALAERVRCFSQSVSSVQWYASGITVATFAFSIWLLFSGRVLRCALGAFIIVFWSLFIVVLYGSIRIVLSDEELDEFFGLYENTQSQKGQTLRMPLKPSLAIASLSTSSKQRLCAQYLETVKQRHLELTISHGEDFAREWIGGLNAWAKKLEQKPQRAKQAYEAQKKLLHNKKQA